MNSSGQAQTSWETRPSDRRNPALASRFGPRASPVPGEVRAVLPRGHRVTCTLKISDQRMV